MLRYLRAQGCPHSLAEEIAQEAFLRLHRGLGEGLRVTDVRAWLFRVARNLWIDSRREHQRYHESQDRKDGPLRPHRDCAPDPERQVLDRERLRLIEEAISRLPKMQRECMRLKFEGMRYHEIAVALSISMTAAVDHVRRGVRRLERLKELVGQA